MNLDDIIGYAILGIITGGFCTIIPVMMGHIYNVILSIFRNA